MSRVTSISVPDGERPDPEVIAARIDLGAACYHEICCPWLMWTNDESLFYSEPDCDCGGPEMAKAYAETVSDSGGRPDVSGKGPDHG